MTRSRTPERARWWWNPEQARGAENGGARGRYRRAASTVSALTS